LSDVIEFLASVLWTAPAREKVQKVEKPLNLSTVFRHVSNGYT